MRLRSRREDAEIERRTMDAIRRMMHRVEGEIGAMDVGGGGRRSTAAVVAAPAMMTAAAAGEKKRRPPTSSSSPTMPSPMMASGWTLTASSVHGDGDKITLPPSVIETLMADDGGIGGGGRPVAFRIGIPNPEYAFPASAKMGDLIEDVRGNLKKRGIITAISSSGGDPDKDDDGENATMMANERDDDDGDDDDDDDDERQHARAVEAYTDELSHRYLSYTHGTVVEFTEDEGGVGLPSSVSSALLRPNRHSPSRRSRARGGRRGGGGGGGGGGAGTTRATAAATAATSSARRAASKRRDTRPTARSTCRIIPSKSCPSSPSPPGRIAPSRRRPHRYGTASTASGTSGRSSSRA